MTFTCESRDVILGRIGLNIGKQLLPRREKLGSE